MAGIRSIEFPIRLAGLRAGTVNCYLVTARTGYVLVDASLAASRAGLEREPCDAGCRPGDLRLIVITHGGPDHAGNGADLRGKYGAKIVMHRHESGGRERGRHPGHGKPFPMQALGEGRRG